jgi:hypothetical protein
MRLALAVWLLAIAAMAAVAWVLTTTEHTVYVLGPA